VYASTEILDTAEHPSREDLGLLHTRLRGAKYAREEGAAHDDAPPGWKRIRIFDLERTLAVKRRSHYA